jgi:hypothetical protein
MVILFTVACIILMLLHVLAKCICCFGQGVRAFYSRRKGMRRVGTSPSLPIIEGKSMHLGTQYLGKQIALAVCSELQLD